MIKPKGLQDFLNEDPSLTEKITYEEFENGQKAINMKDDGIAEAYESYRKDLEAENTQ